MLNSLLDQLNPVPPVPSLKTQAEPLQATDGAAVPPVPPVPPKKTKSKTETNITNAEQVIPPLLAVPPVPSRKKQREPLQPTNGAAVPSVPPVPSEKTKSKTETNITNAEQIARAYCASIGETDDGIINDVITQCRHSAEALDYYAALVDRSSAGSLHSLRALAGGGLVDAHRAGGIITCQTCGHWQAFSLHGRGPGVCGAGVQGTGVCRWGSTEHSCSRWCGMSKKTRGH